MEGAAVGVDAAQCAAKKGRGMTAAGGARSVRSGSAIQVFRTWPASYSGTKTFMKNEKGSCKVDGT